MHRPDYSLQKVREHAVYTRGQAVIASLDKHIPGQIKNVWDTLYSNAFLEVETGGKTFRFTDISWAAFNSWLSTNIPSSAGYWTDNAVFRVFEVFEPGDSTLIAYNSMYSSARGGNAYNRAKGRGSVGLERYYETDLSFRQGYWGGTLPEPGKNCLDALFSISAASHTDSAKVIWFPVSRRNLYRQPSVGSMIHLPMGNSRWAYNIATSKYELIPTGNMYFTVGTPMFIGMANNDPYTRVILNMGYLKGTRYFKDRFQGVLIYPLQSGNYRAVYMKPYGVDTLGVGHVMNAEWQVVAEYVYSQGEREISHKVISVFDPWDDWDNMHRVHFHTALGFPTLTGHAGLDDPRVSDFVQFYARHIPTGRRTQIFSRRLQVLRRKRNISICLIPELAR